MRHALIDGGYAKQRANCEKIARIIGVKALRDMNMEELLKRKEEFTSAQFLLQIILLPKSRKDLHLTIT